MEYKFTTENFDAEVLQAEVPVLVDFFEDYDLPLRFSFHDANYAYIGYDEFKRVEKELKLDNHIVDGEDQ